MIIGIRPSLGFIGYMIFNKSVFRFTVAMAAFFFITAIILYENNRTLNLRFVRPSPFPPPIVLLPDPSKGKMTPLDACSIEAATSIKTKPLNPSDKSSGLDEQSPKSSKPFRDVTVYLWKNTLTTRDQWGYFASQLPGSHIRYLDISKMIKTTPIVSWHGIGGFTSLPGWLVWCISAAASIWTTGGIVMPLGTVMTHSVRVQSYGDQTGLVVLRNDQNIDPSGIGFPPEHISLHEIITLFESTRDSMPAEHYVDWKYGTTEWLNKVSDFLTTAMTVACAYGEPKSRYFSEECSTFTFLDSESVSEGTLEKAASNGFSKANTPTGSFFRYSGDPEDLMNPKIAKQFFRYYGLKQFCPNTTKILRSLVADL